MIGKSPIIISEEGKMKICACLCMTVNILEGAEAAAETGKKA
jgi:hypothetical protein